MPRRRTAVVALGAALTVALSGCSAALTRPAAAPSRNAYNPDAAAAGATSTSPDSTPGPSVMVPLAGTDFDRHEGGSSNTVHLRFDVLSLARRGRLLQLEARIRSLDPVPTPASTDPLYLSWDVDGLSDTTRDKTQPNPVSGIGIAYSGTTLVDAAAKKRYLVAVDSRGSCLCTADLLQKYLIGPGQSLTLDATYAAPPAATTKLDVDVPGIGDFADVPIS